jgi:hypothetical protein
MVGETESNSGMYSRKKWKWGSSEQTTRGECRRGYLFLTHTIVSNNYFLINVAFFGYTCLLRLPWLLIASSQGKIIHAVAESLFSMFRLQGKSKQSVKAARHDGHTLTCFSSIICLMRWQSCFPPVPVVFALCFRSEQTQG